VPSGEENFLTQWKGKSKQLKAVSVSISFAEPYQTVTGELEVYEEDKIIRTIAIDRTRNIKYVFVEQDFTLEDPNDISKDETDGLDSDDTMSEEPDSETNNSEQDDKTKPGKSEPSTRRRK